MRFRVLMVRGKGLRLGYLGYLRYLGDLGYFVSGERDAISGI